MKQKFLFIKAFIIYFFLNISSHAIESDFFIKGVEFFNNDKFEKSKIFFERDIVYNPRSENSYLYLAKIFNNDENEEQQEINLNNVLLLNPKNEEALYMLTLIKISQSDYAEAKNLINKFDLVCEVFCNKQKEIKDKLKKLTPENEASNN